MTDFNRRAFLGVAGLAAGAGVFGLDTSVLGGWAEQQAPSFPDEILNPVEVSGEEAVPIIGRLPGARRMYVLPANVGEHHLVGSQVMTRIARPVETGNVHELMTFAGRTGRSCRGTSTGAAMPRCSCSAAKSSSSSTASGGV